MIVGYDKIMKKDCEKTRISQNFPNFSQIYIV